MKKRLCAILLMFCLTLALLPETAAAVTVVASGECGEQGNNLTWTLDDARTLTISGTGEMNSYRINYHYPPWYSQRDNIRDLNIESGVTSIGSQAFYGCSNLTNISIPNSVTSLEYEAFCNCSALISITIPDSARIWDDVFSGCDGLTSVNATNQNANYSSIDGILFDKNKAEIIRYPAGKPENSYMIPNGVTSIKDGAFDSCVNLTSIIIPSSMTVIGYGAFCNCSSLTSITIPNSVTNIQGEAFSYCVNLTDITIPNSVISIENAAFRDCNSLTSITFPDSVASIDHALSHGCSSLTAINVDNQNSNYSSIDGVLFNKNAAILIQYPAGKLDNTYMVPTGVTNIADFAFNQCSNLTSITIPNSVTTIERMAFNECSNLTDVYYSGTKFQWAQVTIEEDNGRLNSATIHCTDGDIMPDKPVSGENSPNGSGSEPIKPEYTPLTNGVKYVPYCGKADDYKVTSDTAVHYDLVGTLPSGLSLDPETSYITGVPIAEGTWEFIIKRTLSDIGSGEIVKALPYSLTILDNTDNAVQRPNDYEIIIPVGTPDRNDSNHFYKDGYTEETLKIDGPYDEFYRLLIDGRELTQPDDYTAEEGSTVITIHAETFQRFGEGTHTIAAEFRPANAKNDPSQTKRVAQNYTLQLPHSASGGSGNGSGGRSRPSINPNAQKPQQPQDQQQTTPFSDVMSTEWYYEDVVWAYQEGLMQGIDGTHFGPDEKVSQATIVTVLARLAQIDLSQFEGETEPDVPAGQYYTTAAIWAKRAGLMPSGGTFTGSEVTTRDQMAVMLTRYLTSMGKDTTPPAQPVTFEDAAGMSQEGGNAFQVLYQYGIFRGTGGMKMEPNGSTTRAQFVALMHRIYDTAVS